MDKKEKIDLVYKIVDSLYKKLLILVAVAGGFGAYAISFLKEANNYGYMFAFVFILVSVAIFVTYTKLNQNIRELEKIKNG